MRRLLVVCLLLAATPAFAQDPPPRIGPFVVDLHATVPRFPEDLQLSDSRGMSLAELPGTGLGVQVGVHIYPLKWKAITFGIGGEFASSRATQTPLAGVTNIRAATETFQTIAPQLSFNFGTGRGWSYISGGIGQSTWSLIPEGQQAFPSDTDKMRTINYGGGARWFAKPHLAFSFDVRFYAIDPGTPYFGYPGSPRTTLLIIGAGISLK
ncbi:MAG TPA: outer membrane beta-barrel protein [Vicinamibacterales bacterium]|nr:outer membrane beta-barrel protein [Vicinamibacterales bacterium]